MVLLCVCACVWHVHGVCGVCVCSFHALSICRSSVSPCPFSKIADVCHPQQEMIVFSGCLSVTSCLFSLVVVIHTTNKCEFLFGQKKIAPQACSCGAHFSLCWPLFWAVDFCTQTRGKPSFPSCRIPPNLNRTTVRRVQCVSCSASGCMLRVHWLPNRSSRPKGQGKGTSGT